MIIHPAVNHGEIREHALRSKPIVKFNALALLQLVDAQGPVALDYLLDGDVQSYFKAIKNAKPRFVLRRFLSNSFRGPRHHREDDLNDQDGSSGRNKHEQGANSARHGLLRGAGADEFVGCGRDVKQVSLVHVLAAPKPGPAYRRDRGCGQRSARRSRRRSLKASLATPDNSRVRLLVTARRAASSPCQRAKPFCLGSEIRLFQGPVERLQDQP